MWGYDMSECICQKLRLSANLKMVSWMPIVQMTWNVPHSVRRFCDCFSLEPGSVATLTLKKKHKLPVDFDTSFFVNGRTAPAVG